MNRKHFLRSLFAGSLGVVATRGVKATSPTRQMQNNITLCEVYVAGVQHHEWYRSGMRQNLHVGSMLLVRYEPTNPEDSRAIALYTPDGVQVGFIPRWINHIPATLLHNGALLECTVSKYNAHETHAPWHLIKVMITLSTQVEQKAV